MAGATGGTGAAATGAGGGKRSFSKHHNPIYKDIKQRPLRRKAEGALSVFSPAHLALPGPGPGAVGDALGVVELNKLDGAQIAGHVSLIVRLIEHDVV